MIVRIGRGASDRLLDERLAGIAVNQCCVLGYTSGTTGNPKGTMLSHVNKFHQKLFKLEIIRLCQDNIVYTAVQNTAFFQWGFGEEKVLSYLPQVMLSNQKMIWRSL